LKAKQQQLVARDPTMQVDIAFMSEMAGVGGATVLENAFLAALPSADMSVTVESVVLVGRSLVGGSLFSFASSSAQASVRAALELIVSLHEDRRPVLPQNPSGFLGKVTHSLGCFYSCVKEDGTKLVGAVGLAHKLTQSQAQSADATLDQCKDLVKWGFLLTAADQKKANALTRKLVGARGSQGPVKATSNKKKKTVVDVDAEAASVFG